MKAEITNFSFVGLSFINNFAKPNESYKMHTSLLFLFFPMTIIRSPVWPMSEEVCMTKALRSFFF